MSDHAVARSEETLLRAERNLPNAAHAQHVRFVETEEAFIQMFIAYCQEVADLALGRTVVVADRLAAHVTALNLESAAEARVEFNLERIEGRVAEIADQICRSEL